VIDKLRIALAVALVVLAGPAAALGLGQIQVKSKVDQPLLAEIPIISSDPGELEQLQARLASPETFRRIGLEPPTGAAADLQFAVALDTRGNPVIRVTSNAPVSQPLVTFLVEVDWGTGRLVREYSALLDTPRTVSAPAQPPIEAPALAPSNVIERPAEVVPQPEPAPDAAAAASTPEAAPAESNAVAVAPPPAPEPAAAAPVAAAADVTPAPEIASDALPVQRGQTLSQIASRSARTGYTLDQTMLALLRANPDAFIRGNINLLKAGAILRMPDATEISQLSAGEAAVVVHDQIEQWRALRQPALQPAAVAADAAPAGPSPARGAGSTRVAGARLEIVPPAGGNRPGTRSGASAGGEGEMLRQELQQTKEDLAARRAEVDELKARVAELEKLQQQQQSLIQLKDSALAAAEQRLAQASKAAPAQTTIAAAQKPAEASVPTWLWGGAGLLVLGLVAWLATRRRAPRSTPRRGYDSASLAAGMPVSRTASVDEPVREDGPAVVEEPFDASPGLRWNVAPASAPVAAVPTWHGATAAAVPAHVAEPATTSQQLELAKAYIDLGDDDAARVLLGEILNGRDPAARDEAARMLRQL
jgi:pilus assembly protein FimV